MIPIVSGIGPLDPDCAAIVGERLPSCMRETVGRSVKVVMYEASPDVILIPYHDTDQRRTT